MVIRNELRKLIAEQAADMAGAIQGSRGDRVKGIVQSDTPAMDALLYDGAELTARRESLLANYQFRARRERRIYELHTAGHTDSAIAKRMHRAKAAIQRVIARVERSIYQDAFVPLMAIRIWSLWLHGRADCDIAERCACPPQYVREVVAAAIKAWRQREHRGAATVGCNPEFVAKLGNLSPDAAMDAAQRDPEIAEMLQRIGLDRPPSWTMHPLREKLRRTG